MVTTVYEYCPTRDCSKEHIVDIKEEGEDYADTVCKKCGGTIEMYFEDGELVRAESSKN
jgi:transcription initiation factor TFIIIB Brf1 subunit/transcription initiation factor TFIIB